MGQEGERKRGRVCQRQVDSLARHVGAPVRWMSPEDCGLSRLVDSAGVVEIAMRQRM